MWLKHLIGFYVGLMVFWNVTNHRTVVFYPRQLCDIVCYLGFIYLPTATITTAATATANKEAEVRRLVIVSIPMVFLWLQMWTGWRLRHLSLFILILYSLILFTVSPLCCLFHSYFNFGELNYVHQLDT